MFTWGQTSSFGFHRHALFEGHDSWAKHETGWRRAPDMGNTPIAIITKAGWPFLSLEAKQWLRSTDKQYLI